MKDERRTRIKRFKYFTSNVVVIEDKRLARSIKDERRQSRLFRYEPAGISIRAPCFIKISIRIRYEWRHFSMISGSYVGNNTVNESVFNEARIENVLD